ncbi:hypothetical protein DEO72_LG8g1869 [Vigna unguiculata]|uniref:Uncharacterized protein n=1 Tax=Vigna unguiculata TaxID=3917 RepID=A0A4D6MQM2_VIGUN|nr:hypothetical protein DEO72_LG8g1869 [Vigna unguiculata]
MSGMPVTACTHLGKYELGKTIGEGSFAKEDELLRTTCGTPNYVAAEELNDSSVYMSIMVFLNLHVLHDWPSCLVKTLCKDIISPCPCCPKRSTVCSFKSWSLDHTN